MTLEWVESAVGADEAGRGPLAGPVVAAAVRLPEGFDARGLNDSKRLSPASRERWAIRIKEAAVWSISLAEPEEIDRLNILHASEAALARAINAILGGALALVDGHRIPPGIRLPARSEVKGDGRFAAIAAASVLAKTHRDQLMREAHERWPVFGFDQHFGYPTPLHLAALREHGPCPIHRRSFGPVAQACLL